MQSNVAPLFPSNNVKPTFRFVLINQGDRQNNNGQLWLVDQVKARQVYRVVLKHRERPVGLGFARPLLATVVVNHYQLLCLSAVAIVFFVKVSFTIFFIAKKKRHRKCSERNLISKYWHLTACFVA